MTMRKVCLACDNVNVLGNIGSDDRGPYRHFTQGIQTRVGVMESPVFVHDGRTSNFDAHSLARSSIYFGG
jgi:hypothetical protein